MSVCAFTGYRPQKLPYGDDEASEGCRSLKQRMFCEILQLTRKGVRTFITGMARGVDTWAAEIVLELRDALPELGIQLWAAIPYRRQASAWSEADRQRREDILARADKVEHISLDYFRGALQKRNRWMVDHADYLLAVYDGKPGGTKFTIDYACKKGVQIIQIEP